jgi:predicted DNA-binding transcriptional regulator AlpA
MNDERGWTILIEVAGDEPSAAVDFEARVASLATALDRYSAVVSIRADRSGCRATLSLDGPIDASGAVDAGVRIFTEKARAVELPDWPVVRVEVLTFSAHDAEVGERNVPDLVGVTEIARVLGITRQRATKLTKQQGFPEPVALLASGSVWTRSSLDRFLQWWTRKRGRPPLPFDRDEIPEVLKLRAHVIELTNRLHHASDPVEAGIITAELRAITARLRAVMDTETQPRDARDVERVPNPKITTVDPVWPTVERERDEASTSEDGAATDA